MDTTQNLKTLVIEYLEGFADLYADPECDTISGLRVGRKMASKAEELTAAGVDGSASLRAAIAEFRADLALRPELYDELTADKAIRRLIDRIQAAH